MVAFWRVVIHQLVRMEPHAVQQQQAHFAGEDTLVVSVFGKQQRHPALVRPTGRLQGPPYRMGEGLINIWVGLKPVHRFAVDAVDEPAIPGPKELHKQVPPVCQPVQQVGPLHVAPSAPLPVQPPVCAAWHCAGHALKFVAVLQVLLGMLCVNFEVFYAQCSGQAGLKLLLLCKVLHKRRRACHQPMLPPRHSNFLHCGVG
mmetsp:Transcript_34237/g.85913  ORF Transcript_34237/g.85913 Transcript_34237/m.85913 type:complete len:201 (-) Transcript_34237:72-674(-)